jgi:hypothetical protein
MAELAAWRPIPEDAPGPAMIRQINTQASRNADLLARVQRDGVRAITASATLTAADNVVGADTTSGNVTVTLPPPGPIQGHRFTVKKLVAGNTLTVSSSANIDGSGTSAWTTNQEARTFESTGTTYWIVGRYTP